MANKALGQKRSVPTGLLCLRVRNLFILVCSSTPLRFGDSCDAYTLHLVLQLVPMAGLDRDQ